MGKLRQTIYILLMIDYVLLLSSNAQAAESMVYQVFRQIDLGESDRQPPKDIFINQGTSQGLKKGTLLDVYRKISSFDNLTQKLVGDHMIPVGRVKVIYVDQITSIARVEQYVSLDSEPGLTPQAIMVGDIVRLSTNSK